MNYVFISANYAAFLIAKNAAPLVPFLLHSKLPKVVYSDLPITSFNKEVEETFVFHPYFLKQYNKRWFLFGKRDSFENWTNLALDRICNVNTLEILDFIASKETHNEYFEDIVGVSKPPNPESLIVSIKVSMTLWPYIDSKPIHPSQTFVERTAECVILTLDIIPNYEFFSHILGYGSSIEILAPASVRDSMHEKLEDTISRYKS